MGKKVATEKGLPDWREKTFSSEGGFSVLLDEKSGFADCFAAHLLLDRALPVFEHVFGRVVRAKVRFDEPAVNEPRANGEHIANRLFFVAARVTRKHESNAHRETLHSHVEAANPFPRLFGVPADCLQSTARSEYVHD